MADAEPRVTAVVVDDSRHREMELLACKGAAAETSRLFGGDTSLRVHHQNHTSSEDLATIVSFCDRVEQRRKEESSDDPTLLEDVSNFLTAMSAQFIGAHEQKLRNAAMLPLMIRQMTLPAEAVGTAIQTGVQQHVGAVVYSRLRPLLTTMAGGINNAAADDAKLEAQRSLLQGQPQSFLDIDASLVSPTGWELARQALGKISNAGSPSAQLDCLVAAAEAVLAPVPPSAIDTAVPPTRYITLPSIARFPALDLLRVVLLA